MEIQRTSLRELQQLQEDMAEYFCDEHGVSGETYWTCVESIAQVKLMEVTGEIKFDHDDLKKFKEDDYIAWIGHATFLIKLGETTIITDPVFSKNAGPLIFGPDRFTEPALKLSEIPKIDLFLLTHNHYDHQDMSTIRKFPYKDAKVLLPLRLGKYFKRYKDVNEMDWYDQIIINEDLKISLLPAVHWSKLSLIHI